MSLSPAHPAQPVSAGLGFLTAVLVIFCSGMLAQSWIGSLFVRMTELVFQKLPFVTVIYSAAKQIGQAIDPQSENAAFKECVLIRHPRHGEYALAFVTGECFLQVRARARAMAPARPGGTTQPES